MGRDVASLRALGHLGDRINRKWHTEPLTKIPSGMYRRNRCLARRTCRQLSRTHHGCCPLGLILYTWLTEVQTMMWSMLVIVK